MVGDVPEVRGFRPLAQILGDCSELVNCLGAFVQESVSL